MKYSSIVVILVVALLTLSSADDHPGELESSSSIKDKIANTDCITDECLQASLVPDRQDDEEQNNSSLDLKSTSNFQGQKRMVDDEEPSKDPLLVENPDEKDLTVELDSENVGIQENIQEDDSSFTSSQELNKNLVSYTEKEYIGRWTITDPKDKRKVSHHIDNISGVAKTKFYYDLENEKFPTMKIFNILYDGEYRDKVVYHQLSVTELIVSNTTDHSVTFYDKNKSTIREAYGRLYSIIQENDCYIDVSATLTSDGSKNEEIHGRLVLKSDGECFPKELTIDLDSLEGDHIPSNRFLNYVIVLNLLLIFFCFTVNAQCQEAEQNHTIATRISMITLTWNTIWNFCCFNVHLSYALQFREYAYFGIPAISYFILCFIFELRLLLVCWKAKNSNLFNQGNEAVRRALIGFYIKFYLVALVSLLTIDRLVSNKFTLFVLCGGVLIPQIIENAINKSRSTPRLGFSALLAVTQGFFALYIKGCPNNILELEPDIEWAFIFAGFIFVQLTIMYLQRKCGSRFFIPKFCRFWNEYNYYRKFNEDLEQGENHDGANTCCICLNPLSYSEEGHDNEAHQQQTRGWFRFLRFTDEPQDAKVYMVTPCNHKYHPSCLKSWMERKLECPFCRTPIPPIDEGE